MRKMFDRGWILPVAALFALSACGHRHALTSAQMQVSSPSPVMKRQILNAVDAGDGDVLVRDLRRAILEHPDRIDLRLQLVNHFEKQGQSELVAEHLRLLAERYPANEELSLRLARSLRAQGSLDEALRILRNLTARQSVETAGVWSLTGILLDELDRPMEGEAEHRRALELAHRDLDVYENNLGFNLMAQGRRDDALAFFESALRRRPRSEVARNNLGAALATLREGEIDTATVLAHWMSVTDPASAHNNLAAVLIEQERYAEARKELEQSLQLRPDLPAAWKNLQLLSELDGHPVTIPRPYQPVAKAKSSASAWQRAWHGVRKTFVTDEPVLKPGRSSRRSTQRASR